VFWRSRTSLEKSGGAVEQWGIPTGTKMSQPNYDWNALEQFFIHSDKKLIELSKGKTGFSSSPPYSSLRKRAGKYDWSNKRAEAKALLRMGVTEPEKREAIADLNSEVAKLVDAATIIGDHLKLSRSLKAFYGALGSKVHAAIASLDASELSADNVIRALSVLSTLINSATDLERKTLGIAEPLQQIQVEARYVISQSVQGQVVEGNLPALTRDEWYEKYGKNNGYMNDKN